MSRKPDPPSGVDAESGESTRRRERRKNLGPADRSSSSRGVRVFLLSVVAAGAFAALMLISQCAFAIVNQMILGHSMKLYTRPTAPLRLRPQDALDEMEVGHWATRDNTQQLPGDSLGSIHRFASCRSFVGPRYDGTDPTPHSRNSTFRSNLGDPGYEGCNESDWIVNNTHTKTAFQWKTRRQVGKSLRGRWVAFWGDSTTRLLFSALVHLLQGSLENETMPTHDFDQGHHWGKWDHCNEWIQCSRAVYLEATDTMITFRFVTRISEWPKLSEVVASYGDHEEFKRANWTKAHPDVVLLNDGPWEFYSYGGGVWKNDSSYERNWESFLATYFGANGTMPEAGLVVVENSACPMDTRCEASDRSCVDAMAEIAAIQENVLRNMTTAPNIRYAKTASLFRPLPEGYDCKSEGYHLPGAVTEARLNLALHAIV